MILSIQPAVLDTKMKFQVMNNRATVSQASKNDKIKPFDCYELLQCDVHSETVAQ